MASNKAQFGHGWWLHWYEERSDAQAIDTEAINKWILLPDSAKAHQSIHEAPSASVEHRATISGNCVVADFFNDCIQFPICLQLDYKLYTQITAAILS